MTKISVAQKLLHLVADGAFAQIDELATRPNLFRIVGRTHTETWHSMFLGWLLDPQGSHGLGSFPLRRVLVATMNPTIEGSDSELDRISRMASVGDLESARVIPNEREQFEFSCQSGRFDIFIENLATEDDEGVILIEQKVGAPINKDQCMRYADWLWEKHPTKLKVPILIAPEKDLGISSEETTGDKRWYGINYQILHDTVLIPIRHHPALRNDAAILIEQYIDALRIPINGRKLAVTDEEKELALELYERHREAFEAIAAALSDTIDIDLSAPSTRAKLQIDVGGTLISGGSVPEFFKSVMKHILDNELFDENALPFKTSDKRYLISKTPMHPNKNDFRVPVEYKGLYMEAHKNRIQALKDASRFLQKLGCTVKIPETS